MAKHTLIVEPDYDFLMIGVSSHAKDYRICWAINQQLNIDLKKTDSLEIKGKKQSTVSFFSFFIFEDEENFLEYSVLSNLSESKAPELKGNTLFPEINAEGSSLQNEWLIPEQKHFNYFLIVKGEINDNIVEQLLDKLNKADLVLTAVEVNVVQLKSKQNLIF